LTLNAISEILPQDFHFFFKAIILDKEICMVSENS